MCGVNHSGFTNPGYLFNVGAGSVAPDGALFTRLLAHHDDIGLDDGQIRGLLDISREYHERQQVIHLRMAVLAEQVEHKRGRLGPDEIAERKAALDERADLFRTAEQLFFETGGRGLELLTDEQVEQVATVYHEEKTDGLHALADALDNAVGPQFSFHALPAL
ncbi:hypothetical protein [Frankia sp. KB5]|uniref:hypothetical protein n=1 Tax=Frankia sp. KB5 TaxID=683318 RepID=UPI000A108E92|nr:hypothetical protein [Frankia sp. KB5]ORT46780.1 hypothetical protein KBI5_23355 [Frankia sp. KB5]